MHSSESASLSAHWTINLTALCHSKSTCQADNMPTPENDSDIGILVKTHRTLSCVSFSEGFPAIIIDQKWMSLDHVVTVLEIIL